MSEKGLSGLVDACFLLAEEEEAVGTPVSRLLFCGAVPGRLTPAELLLLVAAAPPTFLFCSNDCGRPIFCDVAAVDGSFLEEEEGAPALPPPGTDSSLRLPG